MADAQIVRRETGRWQVRWRARDGRRRGRTFDSRVAAEAFLAGIRHEQVLRRDGGSYSEMTLDRFVGDKWMPAVEARVARTTRETWGATTRNHILPSLGAYQLNEIRVEDIDALYRAAAARGLGYSSLVKLRSVISNIFNEARRLGYANTDPVSLSRLPGRAPDESDSTVLTLDAATRVAEEAGRIWPGYRALILVAAGAGLRWGEAVALTPRDIDLDAGLIRVERALSEVAGEFEIKAPKTRSSRRISAYHADIEPALATHLAEHALPERVFPAPGGGWLRRSNFRRRVWKPSLERAGLDDGLTFHSLRASYATLLAEMGATPRAVADMLGHSKVSTTLDIYSRRFEGQAERMADLLGHRRLRAVGD